MHLSATNYHSIKRMLPPIRIARSACIFNRDYLRQSNMHIFIILQLTDFGKFFLEVL